MQVPFGKICAIVIHKFDESAQYRFEKSSVSIIDARSDGFPAVTLKTTAGKPSFLGLHKDRGFAHHLRQDGPPPTVPCFSVLTGYGVAR
jgi:hypothetical protein